MSFSPITSWQIDGETCKQWKALLLGLQNHCRYEIKDACFLEEKLWPTLLKSRGITLLTKVHIVKAMVFPVVKYRWGLDHEEGWALKNWYFWTVVLEKTPDSPLDSKEIKPVNPKGNLPFELNEYSIFMNMQHPFNFMNIQCSLEAPILWPPDAKSWLTGKGPDAGKDWGQEEKGATEDEMVGWHHWLSGHEFEPTLGEW